MYQRILVPTDGSELSRKAVRSAAELAAKIGAAIVAVNVVPRYPTSYFEGGVTWANPQDIARVEKEWADRGQALADEAAEAARQAGVAASAITVTSDLVAEAILSAAEQHRCDLVVMASHGRKGLTRVLLGSETQHVLTHGNIPVLVVR